MGFGGGGGKDPPPEPVESFRQAEVKEIHQDRRTTGVQRSERYENRDTPSANILEDGADDTGDTTNVPGAAPRRRGGGRSHANMVG